MTYVDDLLALATELNRLATVPPAAAMTGLGDLLDSSSPAALSNRLRAARAEAGRQAAEEAGGASQLAAVLGLPRMAVWRAIHGREKGTVR